MLRILGLSLLMVIGPTTVHADPPHGHVPPGQRDRMPAGDDFRLELDTLGNFRLRFDEVDIRIINEWVALNPNLSGYRSLPPGIARNVARGKPIPPGIARQQVPVDLAWRLTTLPEGYGRFVIGDDLVLVEITTGLIIDVLDSVFGNRG